jgi:hypothetical protein
MTANSSILDCKNLLIHLDGEKENAKNANAMLYVLLFGTSDNIPANKHDFRLEKALPCLPTSIALSPDNNTKPQQAK